VFEIKSSFSNKFVVQDFALTKPYFLILVYLNINGFQFFSYYTFKHFA